MCGGVGGVPRGDCAGKIRVIHLCLSVCECERDTSVFVSHRYVFGLFFFAKGAHY